MKLVAFRARRYRSLRDVEFTLQNLNVLIGTNASGKSTVLDALRFFSEAVRLRSYAQVVDSRGGFVHLSWKGQRAAPIHLEASFEEAEARLDWSIELDGPDLAVVERLERRTDDGPIALLEAKRGSGRWWSGQRKANVPMKLTARDECALAAASADESFAGRAVAAFLRSWGFFDPNPSLLRRASFPDERNVGFDASGRNLAHALQSIAASKPEIYERVLSGTASVLGFRPELEFRQSDNDGRVFFTMREPGLRYPVHQVGASSGTLRLLALMTALYGSEEASLVGIEEPENYIHPKAIHAFAEHLVASASQLVVTTHSPELLDALDRPECITVVRRTDRGTKLLTEPHPDRMRKALEESGFGLGELHESRGFGS